MRLTDLLLELKKPEKPKYDVEHFGNYIVTMSKTPVIVPSVTGDKAQFVAKVQHKTQKDRVVLAAGNSQGEARDNAFTKIHATDRPEDPDAFSNFTVDLNVHFSREYFDPRTGGYLKIDKLGNTPVLVMASRQYFATFGKDMESLGFRKAHIGRTKPTASPDAAEMYNFNISRNEIKSLGLIPSMRYSLEEIEQDDDGNRMFKMIPDTRTSGRSDKYRMPGPGLTIAATDKKESLDEGYVQRNGAAFSLFGLRLHFYSDHVFYVVKGGPDISIYRDGASTPRNDEIYVKDAAARGVPKDIIQVISYWLNTPDNKQQELLPRIEQALEHIAGTWLKQHAAKKEEVDEALLSPRVHEIFLKGLVGAILSGGLSLGIDYAKEKTADYDRQGLQAVYKSIDPREYPQLTKKLTPKDRQGLDAILGKLKEHAMKMEDLTEEEKRMSRAGKGVMKYGKDGMKALAKAGRNGASDEKLDSLRDKYNKYDEGTEPDHEASMARGQLMSACKNAMALMKMIEEGDNLEGWVASKITKAADYLSSVHDYMAYEEVNEEKQRLDPKCWTGYRKQGTKMKGGVRVNNCVKVKK